jgi:uncharacterized protein
MDRRQFPPACCDIGPTLLAFLLTMSGAVLADVPPLAAYPNYPSETPVKFTPVTDSYDYSSRLEAAIRGVR